MPALRAISLVGVPCRPRAANSSKAIFAIASRRSSAVCRVLVAVAMSIGS